MSTLRPPQIAILDASIAAVLHRLDLQGLAGQRLFITGGTGFFGLWLLSALRALNDEGVPVQACVLSRDPDKFLSRHPQFRAQPWLDFVTGNVRDFALPERKFDLLLHAATETSMAAHADPVNMFDDIVLGTRRVLQLARSCGVRRALLVSSGAVYGAQPPHLTHQPDDSQAACNPLLPSSAYGEGKRVMELMGAMLQRETGIEFLVARCFAFCGPGLPLDAHFAIGNFIRDALYGEQINVQGDGSPMRSYLYGADLAVWLLYMLVNGRAGESYNVGSDEGLSIKELALRVRDVLAPGKRVAVLQNAEAEPSVRNRYVPGITRARALGCAPWTSLDESLVLSARYWQDGART
ncbi:NAD-dependent epimerase/dehydratase family protein [Ramlibacter ginsenosidimutans]|uniref:NAD-dependent epimerase/dehydratase family protein n=1 Tax=Ramlibacter ginsenosidimutans TaxID=502333 RepID=A0A934TR31_9BURK|nr:NAD-dependent epimerase/dehydratase family protein [Ramlibacter ginsenosidimutans]MBK6005371.1 NAD-dependent epimerase/dehydratase family protein [Ramlibacter ginsenosidimutans]